jgi:hypothetical protein
VSAQGARSDWRAAETVYALLETAPIGGFTFREIIERAGITDDDAAFACAELRNSLRAYKTAFGAWCIWPAVYPPRTCSIEPDR